MWRKLQIEECQFFLQDMKIKLLHCAPVSPTHVCGTQCFLLKVYIACGVSVYAVLLRPNNTNSYNNYMQAA